MTALPLTTPAPDAVAAGAVAPAERDGAVVAASGVLSAVAFVGAAVLFADALAGSGSAAEAASSLDAAAGRTQAAVMILTLSSLLACVVVAALAGRVARHAGAASRLVLPLGVAHFLLAAAAFWPLAGAASVAANLFDGDVSAVGAEVGLISLNALQPLAALVGAGFLATLALAGRGGLLPRWLVVTAGVLAVGLLLPPVSWAVVYLLPLWVAGAGVSAGRRHTA